MYEKVLRGRKESTNLGPSLWLPVGGENTKLYQGLSGYTLPAGDAIIAAAGSGFWYPPV